MLAHDYEDGERARRRSPSTRGSTTSPARPTAACSWTWTSSCPATRREVVEGLRSRGLDERALISSHYLDSLAKVGELAPGIAARLVGAQREARLHQELPARRARLRPAPDPARADARARPRARSREGRCEALMANRLLVTRRLVSAVHGAGGQLYVWTVDDAEADRPHGGARRGRRDHERPSPVPRLMMHIAYERAGRVGRLDAALARAGEPLVLLHDHASAACPCACAAPCSGTARPP